MNIILNCFPPIINNWPSIALSILKSFMTEHGYQVSVKYWNIIFEDFQTRFLGGNIVDNKNKTHINLLPFINYLWVNDEKKIDYSNLKYKLLSMNPHWYNLESEYTEKKMKQYSVELDQIITSEILKMDLDQIKIFGITTKCDQWLCGGIVAQKVKELFPEIKIVIGGVGTSDEAIAMLNNFNYFDYAIWGEGEYPLLRLCEYLEHELDTEVPTVSNLAYRDKNGIPLLCQIKKKEYFDLNSEIFPDFSDFFIQTKLTNRSNIYLISEGSRGCHWNRCNFCFLNDGYKYRTKNNKIKIKELKHQIDKYQVKKIKYVDNDVIGKDVNVFDDFLDELIKLKEEYVDLSFHGVEIITKNVNASIVKKMSLGGIHSVQIGYESTSNRLLQKINKKNTFASNLLFIKWAKEFSISISGLNVLQSLLEETVEDIFEAINNLYHLRFFLSAKVIKHNVTGLAISKSSRYYSKLVNNNNLYKWNKNRLVDILPNDYFSHNDKYCLFPFANNNHSVAKQWEFFDEVEKHYINSKYNYKILNHAGVLRYREYFNDALLNEILFEDLLHWKILKSCNCHVSSLQELCAFLPTSNQNEIVDTVKELKCEGLLYHNDDFSEIITPINTNLVL